MRISDWSSDVCSSDLHCSEIFFGDFDAAFARFDLSGGGTEQDQCPRLVETRPELAVGCATVWSRSAIPCAGSGAANAQRGEEAATCLAAHRPRLPDPRLGGRHIEVAPDSVLDKSVETGIAQSFPPPRQVGGARRHAHRAFRAHVRPRSEEHTSELQSLMSISYAVFCLKKKHNNN